MDWYDKLKRFLGLSERHEQPPFNDQDRYWSQPPSHSDEPEPPFPGRNFSIFSDPLEIHKYFEQQMSEMLKNFGFNEFGDNGFGQHFNFPQFGDSDSFNFPQIEGAPHEDIPSGDLRDQFLKPGYEKESTQLPKERKDKDLDGTLDIRDWSSVFKGENSVQPRQRQAPQSHFFGQSVTSKTIRNPDGSVETHHTVRDSQGNEETTVTKKIGDKEYSITKRRDKDGKEETIENLVNLNETEVDKYFPKKTPDSNEPRWPFYDRFFH